MQITPRINLEIEPKDGVFDIELTAKGTLTHEDYMVMIPMLDATLKSVPHAKVNMLINALEFTGWELEAAWDDFKFGLEYKNTFLKIAIVGTKTWQEYAVKMGNWFIDGEVKHFHNIKEAKDWIK